MTAPPAPEVVAKRATSGLPADSAGRRIQHLLEAARETLHMDVAFVTALDGTTQTFTHLTGDAASFGWEPGTTIPEADGYCHYVLAGDLPNAVPDARHHPVASQIPATAGAGIGSYVGVPLTLGNGRVYGALCVSSHAENQDLGPSDVAMMNFLSRLIAEELTELERVTIARSVQQRELAAWLAPGGLTIHVQPIVDLATGIIHGVEALTRFPGHTGSPADIFTSAHDYGMGAELELAAIRAAVELFPLLPEPLYLSLNVSPSTVRHPGLEELLLQIPGPRVLLELTEHVDFTGHTDLRDRLAALRQHGVRIAIDDTGSGYAGLQVILALAPDVIKLDIALIKNIDQDPVRRALTRALVDFAAASGAVIVAEGVENQYELDALLTLGVTFGQGYHLCPPAAIEDLCVHPPHRDAHPEKASTMPSAAGSDASATNWRGTDQART